MPHCWVFQICTVVLICYQHIITIFQIIPPIVPGVSNIHVMYFETVARHIHRRHYRRLLRDFRNDPENFDNGLVAALVDDSKVEFVCFLLHSIGKVANQQLFYISLVNRLRGLSRSGLDFNSKIGTMLASSTFDIYWQALLVTLQQKAR